MSAKDLTREQVRKRAEKLCAKNPELQQAARDAWSRVWSSLEDRAAQRRPVPKVFEVHHEGAVAREAMLRSIAAGEEIALAEKAAREAIGLPAGAAAPVNEGIFG